MKIKTLVLLVLTILPSYIFAVEDARSSFRMVSDIEISNIVVPTLVEISLPSNSILFNHIGIYDVTGDVFIPYRSENKINTDVPLKIISTGVNESNLLKLVDKNYDTVLDFPVLNNKTASQTTLKYQYDYPISTDSFEMQISNYSSLPSKISILANVNGSHNYIVSDVEPDTNYINFPLTSSDFFEVHLSYAQPLRFHEMYFRNVDVVEENMIVRFIAEPNKQYQIYSDPEIIVDQNVGERPNFNATYPRFVSAIGEIRNNVLYQPTDSDGDGVMDVTDNCVNVKNSDQEDLDDNGLGDACEDFDLDGVKNFEDNCPQKPNVGQDDIDLDGIGDSCDSEESRVTEKYPAIVWFAIGFAVLVFIALFMFALRYRGETENNNSQQDNNQPPIA